MKIYFVCCLRMKKSKRAMLPSVAYMQLLLVAKFSLIALPRYLVAFENKTCRAASMADAHPECRHKPNVR